MVVERKDVVLALLGASSGLAGLVLVFLGLIAADLAEFPPGTKPTIIAKRRRPAIAVLMSFALGIACAGASVCWLLFDGARQCFYPITVCLFVAQLLSLVVAASWAIYRNLWGGG